MRLRGRKNVRVVNEDPDPMTLFILQLRKKLPNLKNVPDEEILKVINEGKPNE